MKASQCGVAQLQRSKISTSCTIFRYEGNMQQLPGPTKHLETTVAVIWHYINNI